MGWDREGWEGGVALSLEGLNRDVALLLLPAGGEQSGGTTCLEQPALLHSVPAGSI